MFKAADELANRTHVPDYRFDHLMGLDAVDELVDTLHRITGEPVPARLERQRAQLQDAMLDSHFMLGMSRFAIAADPDLLVAFDQMLAGMGAKTVAAVSPVNAPILQDMVSDSVKIGDLEDLEKLASNEQAEVLITNAHGVQSAEHLEIPLLRAGFPQYDQLGGQHRVWIGYRGSRQTLFDLANILLSLEKGEIHPYRSIYSQKGSESSSHAEAVH
jgi:nitrogenase molybdenum-iron protein NifN